MCGVCFVYFMCGGCGASELLGDTVEAEKVRQELRIKKNTPPSSTVVTGDHSATQKDTPPSSAVVTDATADGGTAV